MEQKSEQGISNTPIKFTLQYDTEKINISPIDPRNASMYTSKKAQESPVTIPEIRRRLYQHKYETKLAMSTGWILFSPVSIAVSQDSDGDYTVEFTNNTQNQPDNSNLASIVNLDGSECIYINTLWNISLPQKCAVLLAHPFVEGTRSIEAVYQVLEEDEQTQSKIPLDILCSIDDEFTISRGDALAQLIPIESDTTDAGYWYGNTDKLQRADKENRKRSLYPDKYRAERNIPTQGMITKVDEGVDTDTKE